MTHDTSPHAAQVEALALIGYRGTGKSTVGRILADRLNRPFLDADLEIEAQPAGRSAPIFADWGEAVFRDWEERTLAELTATFPDGHPRHRRRGRAPRDQPRRIRDFGFVVWLRADPAELARRLESDQAAARRPARP